MAANEFDVLLHSLKALADENRLKIISLLSERAYPVGELAQVLELTEPTVSHHLAKLREMGLLNLGVVGNKRFYKLNDAVLGRVASMLTTDTLARINTHLLSALSPAELARREAAYAREQHAAWLAMQDVDEDDRKVLHDYTHADGRLKQIPTQEKKLLAVLRWLAGTFEPDRRYTEREVNALLADAHEDYARLRRELVEFGFLAREGGGGLYWLAAPTQG